MFPGLQHFQVPARDGTGEFPMVVFYPTTTPPRATKLGPYVEQLSPDAPIAPGAHSIVVISHGSGGSHLAYRALASGLACSGYVVALPEHPGNNRNDNRLEGTLENLQQRPRHVSHGIDAMLADEHLGGHVHRDRVVVIGHSMGGYTALALAGGLPQFPPRSGHVVDVQRDTRVRALVLMAPATPWYFAEGALAHVRLPILMLTAEHDPYTPAWHAAIVADGIPDRSVLRRRQVDNAGHFSFLSPFPPEMQRAGFLPATDPEGFDRAAFQHELILEIRHFLQEVLRHS